MTDVRPPVDDLAYYQLHKLGRSHWALALAGTVALGLMTILVIPGVILLAFGIGFAVTGEPIQTSLENLTDTNNVTPMGLAFINLSLAGAIPATWLIIRTIHNLKPRWLASVRPRIRWGWLGACVLMSMAALILTVAVSLALPSQGSADPSGELNDFTNTTRDFILVIVLLTPLQAIGEEYAFRGYLTQAFGSAFNNVYVAVLVPALLFALAHGAQDAPIFFDRFAFGVVAGILVILTGGLEAGIAMHVVNNLLAFGQALAYSDMTSALNPTGGTWWSIPVTLTQSLSYLAFALWLARRWGLQTRTAERAVLAGPSARV